MDGPRGRRPGRRFTLLDGLILIAATAIGMGVSRAIVAPEFGAVPVTIREVKDLSLVVVVAATPVLWALTLALIPLWLRPPRPTRRLLFRHPGWTVGVVAVVAPLAEAARWTILDAIGTTGLNFDRPSEGFDGFRRLLPTIGAGVSLAWFLLFASGRWRADRSWIDRLGRGLGTLWILAMPFFWWLAVIY